MRLSRLRVPLGYAAFALVLVLARPRRESVAAGIALAVLGEGLRIWASGHIEKTQRLATGGPYAHTRNPLYVGSALLALGVAVASASPFVVLAVAAYFAVLYPAVIREESAFLAARFPEEYAAWARDVPAFLPRLRPAGPRATRFDWHRVRVNREWRTAIALPVVAAVFAVRALLTRQ
jgi:protein-S-isoprenylcysteine O-methyltransferase Ste14